MHCAYRADYFSVALLAAQSRENLSVPEEAMLAKVFKRNLSLLIPTALIFFVIQYHETHKVSVLGIAVYLITFLITGIAFEGLNWRWRQRFGTSKDSSVARAVLWVVVAVSLYLFFGSLDRG
jgi:hypothetical protein